MLSCQEAEKAHQGHGTTFLVMRLSALLQGTVAALALAHLAYGDWLVSRLGLLRIPSSLPL